MLFNISLLEWIGYFASVVVAVSLTMSSVVKLRWFNLFGAAAFSFYGFAIQSLPVGLLNLFIVIVNIYYLTKMYRREENFKLVMVSPTDPLLLHYRDLHRKELEHFFPEGMKASTSLTDKSSDFNFIILRDAEIAGWFSGIKTGDKLQILVDYVSSAFRDLKPGAFVYQQNIGLFYNNGIRVLHCDTKNDMQRSYLSKMHFRITGVNDGVYSYEMKVVV